MLEQLQRRLALHLKQDLELVLNENRTIMLNLLKPKGRRPRLSIHKMFLEAPDPVLSAVAHYVRGTPRREMKKHQSVLRVFIQERLARVDQSHLLNKRELVQAGCAYHLGKIFNALNHRYFGGEITAEITWSRSRTRRARRRVTLGQYIDGLRLIKIHQMLDDPFFPEYFVEFIVYHEMLHALIPGGVDPYGRFCFHSRAFKQKEREFPFYEQAIAWEKKNRRHFFKYGRT